MLEFVTELSFFVKIHCIAQLNFLIFSNASQKSKFKSLELKNAFLFQIISAVLTKIFQIPIAKDPNLNKQTQLCLHLLKCQSNH